MGIVGIALIAVVLLASICAYNLLIFRRNAVDNAFAGIDTQLMMRYDLIPNLVVVVKQYASHENEALRLIAELRAQAQKGDLSTDERVRLDNHISQAMVRITVLTEHYPALKASENFQQLQRALNEVEERVAASRRAFNAATTDYNNSVDLFPINLMAAALGYRRRTLFAASDPIRANVSVAASMSR